MSVTLTKPSALFLSPTPPPFSGTELGGEYLLESSLISLAHIHHVRSNIRTLNRERGRVDLQAIRSLTGIVGKCLAILLSKRVDVVYFLISSSRTGLCRDLVYFSLAKCFRKKAVAHYKGSNYANYYSRENRLFRMLIRVLMAGIDILIAESASIGKQFATLIDASKIRVLPPGIDSRAVPVGERDFDATPLKLVFYGNLSFAKGLYDLTRAYDSLLAGQYRVELHLAGEIISDQATLQWLSGAHREFYESHFDTVNEQIRRAIVGNESNGVFYHGVLNTEQIHALCSDAHLLVFLSYSEGFSVSVLEALALGLPMVLTRVGAAPECLVEMQHCLFVDPGDPAGAFEAIRFLADHRDILARMSRQNRALAEELFDVQKIGAGLAAMFGELASDRRN